MASPSKKRKITPPPEDQPTSTATTTSTTPPPGAQPPQNGAVTPSKSETSIASDSASNDRLARFKALRARATASTRSNLQAAQDEANRSGVDPTLLASLSRRADIARHKLLQAETEDTDGKGAFERKRAWDYTIEESERWDERIAEKKSRKDNNAFQDYGAEAGKIYERQIRELEKQGGKDGGRAKKEYDASKRALLDSAARNGDLEIVELADGELVAIDADGRFYATSDSTDFVEQKPKKENVDRLVEDLRKAEEVRMKKRKARQGGTDEGDVTYINEKNKQFNLKLGRFYDRYTVGIREAFERGTAL
jgi:pre-mRNA-splicing factor SYF2